MENRKTIKTYTEDLLKKYEEGKNEYLTELSPSKIREDCLLKFKNGIDPNDLIQFGLFFDLNEGISYLESIRKINEIDIDKFRPFKSFLTRKTNKTLEKNLELIAILLDFKPRPYLEYRKKGRNEVEDTPVTVVHKPIETGETGETKINLKILFGIIATSALFLIFIIKPFDKKNTAINKETRCMIWSDNLYKEAPCTQLKSPTSYNQVVPFEESKIENFKKINVTVTYPFFSKSGEPLVWYRKTRKNKIEFFSAPGKHPITGKTLKAVTPYIIEKYVPIHNISNNSLESFVQ